MGSHLGGLEQLVLLALARLGDDAYGVAVRDEIERTTKRATSFGSIYTTLARLEQKGLIRSSMGEPSAERGGRRKKYFAMTVAGERALREQIAALRTMTRGLDAVLGSR